MSSPDEALDADLHDAFGIMYAAFSDADSEPEEEEPVRRVWAFDKASFQISLDALLALPSIPPRKRIFPGRPTAAIIIPSTVPLPPLPGVDVYAPLSPLPLLARLRTFKPGHLPPSLSAALSARELARHGWVAADRNALKCARCTASWGLGGLEAYSEAIKRGIEARLAASLQNRHEAGCGWRVLPCPVSLGTSLRRLVHPLTRSSLSALARAVQSRSVGPEPPVWSSPVSSAQLATLGRNLSPSGGVDDLALVLALFGWYPHDPLRPSTCVEDGSRTDIVSCRLCLRRVGLWAFRAQDGAQRVMDVRRQHLDWCPLRDEGWWAECSLLEDGETDVKGLKRILDNGEGGRKRWRKVS